MISSEMVSIVGPALIAGLMIALTHAPLGIEVLKRGIIFIDLAVAQIAGLGLVAASVWLHEPSIWLMQAIALICAIAAGLFFRRIEKTMPEQEEAIFHKLRQVSLTSSSRRPQEVINNAMIRLPYLGESQYSVRMYRESLITRDGNKVLYFITLFYEF